MPGALPSHPLLDGLYQVVPLSPDRVQIATAGRSVVLSGEGLTRGVLPLLEALDGRTSLDELGRAFPDLVPDMLEGLSDHGLLSDGWGPDDTFPSGNLGTALAFGHAFPAQTARALAAASVAVAGCGPVGSTVATLLAGAGVGRLLLDDDGQPSPEETAASLVFATAVPRATRAEITRAACASAVDTQAEVAHVPATVASFQIDLGIVELRYEPDDRPSSEADACLLAGVPYLVHTQDALEAVVGPLVRPPGFPCHRCARCRELSNVEQLDEHLAYRRHRGRAAPGPDALSAAHTAVVAGVVATQALHALAGAEAPCDNAALVIDLARMAIEREEILPVPGCPGCMGTVDCQTEGAA